MSSWRAVTIRMGTSIPSRRRRHTSKPSIPGSIRSSSTGPNPRRAQSKPGGPVRGDVHFHSGCDQVIALDLGDRLVVVHGQHHPAASAASTCAPRRTYTSPFSSSHPTTTSSSAKGPSVASSTATRSRAYRGSAHFGRTSGTYVRILDTRTPTTLFSRISWGTTATGPAHPQRAGTGGTRPWRFAS